MNNKTFTLTELQNTKFCELPNGIYNSIIADLSRLFGAMFNKVAPILNNAPVTEIDQYVNIYKYILVI